MKVKAMFCIVALAVFAALSARDIQAQGNSDANASVKGSGTVDRIAKWVDSREIGDSGIVETGGNVGIGTDTPTSKLTVPGRITATVSGLSAAVVGNSPDAIAIVGISNSGVGVSGKSITHSGVVGTSDSGSGVLGESDTLIGVHGLSTNFIGVRGFSGPITGGAGPVTGIGLFGQTVAGTGVRGQSVSGTGVFGHSSTGYAGFFL